MMRISKSGLGIGAFGALIGAVVTVLVVIYAFPGVSNKQELIGIPMTKFDTTLSIPQTSVSLKYPSNGYHGLGADVKLSGLDEGDWISNAFLLDPTVPFGRSEGIGSMGLRIGVREKIENETLDQVIEQLKNLSVYDREYISLNGRRITVNGREWFVYHVSEDANFLRAVALGKEEVVSVTLYFTSTDTQEAKLASGFAPETLRQQLQHIDFE